MRLPMTLRARVRLLVALPPVRDLLLCAKHLFVAAVVAWGGHKTMAGSGRYPCEGAGVIHESRRL